MTGTQTTESLRATSIVIGEEMDATLFPFDPADTRAHTLIISSTT